MILEKELKLKCGDIQDIQVRKSAEKCVKHRINTFITTELAIIEESSYSTKEKLEQVNFLWNLQKIVDNYEELEPVMQEYFGNKFKKEKWEER